MSEISIPKHEWDGAVTRLLLSADVYAPIHNGFCCDYERVDADTVGEICYNKAKPVTPLKKFFLPFKENVTSDQGPSRPIIILGASNCDVSALAFLDDIYMDQEYPDPVYKERRDLTTLISAPCLSVHEHCHCTSYGIDPAGIEHSDLSLALVEDHILLSLHSKKGEAFLESLGTITSMKAGKEHLLSLKKMQKKVVAQLEEKNRDLPDLQITGKLIARAEDSFWKQYAADCVSCGACSAICPSCSCFLLIDKPGFEKVRQLDTCQYPGFGRVAGGEDALAPLSERFKNRYMCKYVWKAETYSLNACTGCGRCIESCIGQINKNELIVDLSK